MSDILGANAPAPADLIKDATIETFQADVMEASMSVPVIVDFWAAWCGPCRTLGPILENQTKTRNGKVKMVKVDTDKNQMLAQQLRIQSLPTVMAFVGGQPVDGFAGALPESEVSAFMDRVVEAAAKAGLSGTTPDLDIMVQAGDTAFDAQDLPGAMEAYAQVAEIAEPGSDHHLMAIAGMARCALTTGNSDQAEQILEMVPADKISHPAIAQIKAMLALGQEKADAPAPAAMPQDTPQDAAGFFNLAQAQLDRGEMEPAIDALLQSLEHDKEWNEGEARAKLLTVFEALGVSHPAVKTGRRRMSALLFA